LIRSVTFLPQRGRIRNKAAMPIDAGACGDHVLGVPTVIDNQLFQP
jgi:hypothetical protein